MWSLILILRYLFGLGDGAGDNDEEEFVFESSNQNEGDDKFDLYVGALQDILMEEEFEKMRKQFSTKYCMEFEATEENKLSYMQIFKEYQ